MHGRTPREMRWRWSLISSHSPSSPSSFMSGPWITHSPAMPKGTPESERREQHTTYPRPVAAAGGNGAPSHMADLAEKRRREAAPFMLIIIFFFTKHKQSTPLRWQRHRACVRECVLKNLKDQGWAVLHTRSPHTTHTHTHTHTHWEEVDTPTNKMA